MVLFQLWDVSQWTEHRRSSVARQQLIQICGKTVLLFSLIPECEGLTYTGKQSWEGFAVSAETRAETFLIALLCH